MYTSRITRLTPAAFIFLIDRSGSTEEKMGFGAQHIAKAEAIAIVTNMLLRELLDRCRREEGTLDYFDIAAIGYSGEGVRMLLGKDFVKPSDLALRDVPRRSLVHERMMPDSTTHIYNDELRCWIEPHNEGATPMRAALEQALLLAGKWCKRPANANSYPPTIFNITDGEASDGDCETLLSLAGRIRELGTSDGNALLININLASGDGGSVIFPSSREDVPESRYARMLYDMSSVAPGEWDDFLSNLTGRRPPFRTMSCNASVADMITMLNVGSRSINRML